MTKIADSYFIDSDTGKRIPVRMEYTGVFKPDTTMITAHNVYRLNNGVAEKLDRSGWRQPNTDDPNYWKTNIRQAAKNQEEPLNSVKYYWNKFTNWIKEDKNGGNMNYASYLQGGGVTPLNAAPLVSKEDIAEIITAALNGTDEIKQKAAKALQEMMQDASLAPLVEQVMSEMGISSLKCGGRVKKKEMGSKITTKKVMAKGGCPCMIKKVGGRLIEVDSCTGLPVHKSGGKVKKYQNASDAIRYANEAMGIANTKENNLAAAMVDSFRTGNIPYMDGDSVDAGSQTISNGKKAAKVTYINGKAYPVYEYVDEDGVLILYNTKRFKPLGDGTYAFIGKNGNLYFNNGRYRNAATGKMENYDPLSFFAHTPNILVALRAHGFLMGPLSMNQEIDKPDNNLPTWRDTFGAGKTGKFGGKTYDEALALQNEMLSADWFNANLGTSGINKNGADGMWGATSQKEWARYLAEKQSREKQANYTNQQLLDLDQAGVAGLSADNKARYDRLQAYQANRNKALTFNGTQYADEQAYNTAVNTANQTAANKYYADLAQQQNTYNGNRAMATSALSSGVQKRRQAAFDNLSALNSGTLDYSKLSYRDIRDMQRQMRRGRRNGLYGNSEEAKEFYAAPGTGMLVPTMAQTYAGPAALTQEQLSATSFKNGGQLNYANYLN